MNTEIRQAMTASNVKQWQVAEKLNVTEFTLSRWLRHELPDDKRRAALDAIRQLAREKAGGAENGEKAV